MYLISAAKLADNLPKASNQVKQNPFFSLQYDLVIKNHMKRLIRTKKGSTAYIKREKLEDFVKMQEIAQGTKIYDDTIFQWDAKSKIDAINFNASRIVEIHKKYAGFETYPELTQTGVKHSSYSIAYEIERKASTDRSNSLYSSLKSAFFLLTEAKDSFSFKFLEEAYEKWKQTPSDKSKDELVEYSLELYKNYCNLFCKLLPDNSHGILYPKVNNIDKVNIEYHGKFYE